MFSPSIMKVRKNRKTFCSDKCCWQVLKYSADEDYSAKTTLVSVITSFTVFEKRCPYSLMNNCKLKNVFREYGNKAIKIV